MSERLSSVEIEDVLSSIRRLVSEDLRPGAKPEVAATAPAAVPAAAPAAESAGADKLILTPALRIGADTETPPPAAEAEAALPSFQSVRQARSASVVDRVARAMPEEDWEPVAEASAPLRSDWATEAEAAAEAAGAAWSEAPIAPVEQPADPVIAVAVERAGENEEAAAPEAWPASDVPEANWSDPGAQAPMEAEPPEDPGWSEVEPMAIDRPAAERLEEAALRNEEGGAMPDPLDPTEKEAPLQAETSADLPDWARMEAEVQEMPAPGPSAAPAPSAAAAEPDAGWADAAEAEIRRELEDEATATVFARFEDDDHDERHFDEEMLRDLVRDIIREELQGALGERITRNVRKLVRAEIARALAVRDFE